MSREVEVQNIQMVATTPEDIQISLGKIYDNAQTPAASKSESYTLAGSTGWLKLSGTEAEAPRGVTVSEGTYTAEANDELDWSNIADISAYYQFGKLIPASSVNGENVFFTPDAAGVGRTLKATAKFYQAAAKTTVTAENDTAIGGTTATPLSATSHILTSTEKTGANETGGITGDGWKPYVEGTNPNGYKVGTDWNATNDDGYYVDIPVWLRTSSTEQPKIYVTGYVTSNKKTATENDTDSDDLYKAVRVAILDKDGNVDKGCLTLRDGDDVYINPVTGQADHGAKFPANLTATATNILDSKNYNDRHSTVTDGIWAVKDTTNATNGNFTDVGHEEILQNNAKEADYVAQLEAGSGTEYGPSTKLIIRVWLEGEDGNCWNENAGQDWNLALKFSKDPLPAGT